MSRQPKHNATEDFVTTFWELFSRSMILSGFITVLCIGCLCYLAITGRPIPEVLVNICLIVVAFFFGTKASNTETVQRTSKPEE